MSTDLTTPKCFQFPGGMAYAVQFTNTEAQAPGAQAVTWSGPPKNINMDPLMFSAPV